MESPDRVIRDTRERDYSGLDVITRRKTFSDSEVLKVNIDIQVDKEWIEGE